MVRPFIVILFFLLTSPVLAQQNSQIYIQLDEELQPHAGKFKQILSESFKRLKHWKNAGNIATRQEQTLETLLADNQDKVDGITLAKIYSVEGESSWFSSATSVPHLSIKLYSVKNGNLILNIERNLKNSSPQAMFSNLESELPLMLKVKLAEVGNVVKTTNELVYFNLGSSAGIKEGQIFRTFKPGEKLTNKQGETFGWIEDTTGVVQVNHTQSTYSTAQILLGRLSISADHYIELASNQDKTSYNGKIISIHENKVAINLGENSGVTDGASYAIFKDIKTIKGEESFREKLAEVNIKSVHEDYSVGEISLSNNYNLSKAFINAGDSVEEIKPSKLNYVSFGQMGTNTLNSGDSKNNPMLGYQDENMRVNGMIYRYRIGYGTDAFASAGIMTSINHSPNFFYGLDGVYLNGMGANFFLSVDVPTPMRKIKINMETGYMAGVGDIYEGFNLNINVKYPFDEIF